MITIGIDWGARRIGVAFATRNVASPLKVLKVRNRCDARDRLGTLVRDMDVEKIVIGVPLDSKGNDTRQSKEVREFGELLGDELNVKVVFWNEALTSKEALRGKLEGNQGKKKRRNLDATAAAYILQSYLDFHSAI